MSCVGKLRTRDKRKVNLHEDKMGCPPLKFGLDWTPNTAHCALFAAAEEIERLTGRKVVFVCPGDASAPPTPADGLLDGTLDVGLVPCDQLVSLQLERPQTLQAVMNLHSHDISALCVLASTTIQRPSDLAGKRYASCGYPLEAATIRSIIRKDCNHDHGVVADEECLLIEECPLLRTKTEDMLLANEADCAWMYLPWEVLRAKEAGIALRCFPIQDYASFGPMNMVCVKRDALDPQLIRSLIAAIQQGARIARDSPAVAAMILSHHVPLVKKDLLEDGIRLMDELGAFKGREGLEYGMFDQEVWRRFARFLTLDLKRKDIADLLEGEECSLWTNEFFESLS